MPASSASKRRATTLMVRVAGHEWVRVMNARGPVEFRATPQYVEFMSPLPPMPQPIVMFTRARAGGRGEEALRTLIGLRVEPLGAIDERGLELAGFPGPRDEAFARFRRAWMIGERRRFEPMRRVSVFTVQPFVPDEVPAMGALLIERLYGAWLNGQRA